MLISFFCFQFFSDNYESFVKVFYSGDHLCKGIMFVNNEGKESRWGGEEGKNFFSAEEGEAIVGIKTGGHGLNQLFGIMTRLDDVDVRFTLRFFSPPFFFPHTYVVTSCLSVFFAQKFSRFFFVRGFPLQRKKTKTDFCFENFQ